MLGIPRGELSKGEATDFRDRKRENGNVAVILHFLGGAWERVYQLKVLWKYGRRIKRYFSTMLCATV